MYIQTALVVHTQPFLQLRRIVHHRVQNTTTKRPFRVDNRRITWFAKSITKESLKQFNGIGFRRILTVRTIVGQPVVGLPTSNERYSED